MLVLGQESDSVTTFEVCERIDSSQSAVLRQKPQLQDANQYPLI